MRERYPGYPTPKKPVVVGDMLFTNTSKRWISTANLREDMILMKDYNGLESAKRSTRQAHDYNMQTFRDHWSRKLDRSRLTKPLSAKKEEKQKKEVAAYLRDVYSDSEDSDDVDTSASDLNRSMASRRKHKKRSKTKQSVTDSMGLIEESTLLAPLEEEGASIVSYISEVSSPVSPYAMSSLASLSKYIPDEPETPIPEIPGRTRPIKSASFHQPVTDLPPPLERRISKSTSLLRHRVSDVLSDVIQDSAAAVPTTKTASVRSDDVTSAAAPEQLNDADVTAEDFDITSVSQTQIVKPKPIDAYRLRGAFGLDKFKPKRPAERVSSAASSHLSQVSKTSMDSASYELGKMNLGPKAFPPIHTMRPRKPNVRPWDYPYAGVYGMSTPPNLQNEEDSRENLHEQLADLKYCRYLRLPPGKYAKRKLEQERKRKLRRKDTVYVVAAGRDFTEHDKRIIRLLTENAAGKWMKKSKMVGAVNPNVAAVAAAPSEQEDNK